MPYVAAMVQLDEDRGGLMVMTNIVDCEPDSVHIGMPVEVTFVDTVEGQKLPMFTPRGDSMPTRPFTRCRWASAARWGRPRKALTARPAAAEQAGYASMWWGDHYMGWIPRSIWTPDISPVARPGSNPDVFFDPLQAMAVAGTATSELSLGVTTESIRRHPVALAQQFLTLQHITGNRAILGLGGGEGENILPYGLEFEKPIGRLEEGLHLLRQLWETDEPVDFDGEHFQLKQAVHGLNPAEGGTASGVDLRRGSAHVPDRRAARRGLAAGDAATRRVRREAGD